MQLTLDVSSGSMGGSHLTLPTFHVLPQGSCQLLEVVEIFWSPMRTAPNLETWPLNGMLYGCQLDGTFLDLPVPASWLMNGTSAIAQS